VPPHSVTSDRVILFGYLVARARLLYVPAVDELEDFGVIHSLDTADLRVTPMSPYPGKGHFRPVG
jgi:hypothetical protein